MLGAWSLAGTAQLLAGTVPQSDLDPHLRVHASMLLRIRLLRDTVLCCDQVCQHEAGWRGGGLPTTNLFAHPAAAVSTDAEFEC